MSFEPYPQERLGALVSITSGRLNSSAATETGAYPFYTCGKEVLRIDHFEHEREAVLLGGNNANAVFPVFYANGRFTARQRVYVIWSNDSGKLDNRFLYYVLLDGVSDFVAAARGTTTLFITLPMLQGVLIPMPEVRMQLRIAALLSAIDDRIALLRETNTTLESIAQALFKSWFVDFDPVHAKQQGIALAGMDEATAALFPDGFEESALGLVPKGWEVRSLDAIATFLNGLALQKFPPTDESWLPVIKIAQLRKGNTVGADRAGRNLKPEYIIQNGDVLFSWSGSLEVEVWCGGEGALNQHLFKVASKDFPKWFYLLWTQHHLDRFRQIAASKATTMGHIQRAHLTEAKTAVPPPAFINSVDAAFGSLLERRIQNELQAQNLASLRDTLLRRLISGQLRIPDAEALLQ
ncbi:restriction endonuclease subunit S [Variovorax paradoxus]|uniref:restriction endonuclease subunit S n=1 Tax=Variovorax paradoxus TaxID=34073 RepID=UPI003ED09FAA